MKSQCLYKLFQALQSTPFSFMESFAFSNGNWRFHLPQCSTHGGECMLLFTDKFVVSQLFSIARQASASSKDKWSSC